jgi:hypothetical protein
MRKRSDRSWPRDPRGVVREVLSRGRSALDYGTAGVVPRQGDRQYRTFFWLGARDGIRHVPRAYDGPVLMLRSEERREDRFIEYWDGLLSGPHRYVDAAGDHRTMLAEPHVTDLAAEVRAAVDDLIAAARR